MRDHLLLEVPSDLDVNSEGFPRDVAWEIYKLNSFWPGLNTPGTQSVNPKKLMHCSVKTDIDDIETLIQGLIIAYSLDWVIAGIQSYYRVIPAVIDWDTNEILEPAKVLSVVPCDTDIIFQYLPDRYAEYDENGNPVGSPLEKSLSWLHMYQTSKVLTDWV